MQILCRLIQPRSLDWIRMSFLKKVMLHIKLKGRKRTLKHYASKLFDILHTPDLFGWVKKINIDILQVIYFD